MTVVLFEILVVMDVTKDLFTVDGMHTMIVGTVWLIFLIVWIYSMVNKYW